MLQDLGYAQTDMVPFGRKPDEHKVDGVLYGSSRLSGEGRLDFQKKVF
ncbi:hypothetical protein [Aeromonas caviae]|nr:hypothetical protein [Aeromonas caviae]